MIKQAYDDALLAITGRETGVDLSFMKMDGFTSAGVTRFSLNRPEAMAVITALTAALTRYDETGVTLRINPLMAQGVIEEIEE